MEKVALGKSGLQVSRMCLGCWQFGKAGWTDVDDEVSVRTIRRAIALGVNFLDTAEGYGNGHSEEVVGRAVKGLPNVVLATKIAPHHPTENARKALEDSLKRLDVSSIDLYQIHWPSPSKPFEKFLELMAGWKAEGLIRAIGVSNFNLEQMQQAVKVTQIDSLQPPFSIVWREIDDELIPFCRERGVMIMTYSSLAQGLILGKYSAKTDLPDDIRSKNVFTWDNSFTKVIAVSDKVVEIARTTGYTPAQVALRWVLQTPGVPCAIVGARTSDQVEDLVKTMDWKMDTADYDVLSALGKEAFSSVSVDSMWNWRPK